jgi:hypothetical protein
MSPEQLAELFHETYERLAPAFGWRTKKGCNVPFAQLPQRNKALMIATCQTVLSALQECGAVANGSQQPQPKICPRCGGTKKVPGPFGGPATFTCVDCDTSVIRSGVR